jgi:hypothetical protein
VGEARQLQAEVAEFNTREAVKRERNTEYVTKLRGIITTLETAAEESPYLKAKKKELDTLLESLRTFLDMGAEIPKKQRVKAHQSLIEEFGSFTKEIYDKVKGDLDEARN